jgi:hypothetical protein
MKLLILSLLAIISLNAHSGIFSKVKPLGMSVLYNHNYFLSAWDADDKRFSDYNYDGQPDITDQIEADYLSEYGVSLDLDLFKSLSYVGADGQKKFYMNYFVERGSGLPFCPTKEMAYKNPIIKTVMNYIQIDTQPLYYAKNLRGEEVHLPKAVLEKIWFHFRNGQEVAVTPWSQMRESIYFYWKSDMGTNRLYKIEQKDTIVLRSADARVGCVPLLKI